MERRDGCLAERAAAKPLPPASERPGTAWRRVLQVLGHTVIETIRGHSACRRRAKRGVADRDDVTGQRGTRLLNGRSIYIRL